MGPPATSWALVEQAAASPFASPSPGSTLSPSAPTCGARPSAPRAESSWGKLDPASSVSGNELVPGRCPEPCFLQQGVERRTGLELSPAGWPLLPPGRWAGKQPFRFAEELSSREFSLHRLYHFILLAEVLWERELLVQTHLE